MSIPRSSLYHALAEFCFDIRMTCFELQKPDIISQNGRAILSTCTKMYRLVLEAIVSFRIRRRRQKRLLRREGLTLPNQKSCDIQHKIVHSYPNTNIVMIFSHLPI